MPPGIISLNGQIGLVQSRQMAAALGKYYVATNPTPGTAIAYANKTAFSATANGLWSISNNNPANSGINIQLDRLRLWQTATAPTGTLYMQGEVYNESGIMAIASAAAAVTPQNINSGFSNSSNSTVTFFNAGAGTVPAAVGARRRIAGFTLATGVTVLGDSFTFDFGNDGQATGKTGLTAARATDVADLVCYVTPVTIAPQTSAYMNLWWVTSGANIPSFEFSLGYIEA